MTPVHLEQGGSGTFEIGRGLPCGGLRYPVRVQHVRGALPEVDECRAVFGLGAVVLSARGDEQRLREVGALREVPALGVVGRYHDIECEFALDERARLLPRSPRAYCERQHQRQPSLSRA